MVNANVRELFSLGPQEKIFDDFNCKDSRLTAGRMYLTENHLCYYRSVIGMNKKIKIAWTDIESITKKGSNQVLVQKKGDPEP